MIFNLDTYGTKYLQSLAQQQGFAGLNMSIVAWNCFQSLGTTQVGAGTTLLYFDLKSPIGSATIPAAPVNFFYYGYFNVYLSFQVIQNPGRIQVLNVSYFQGTAQANILYGTSIAPADLYSVSTVDFGGAIQCISYFQLSLNSAGPGNTSCSMFVSFNGLKVSA